MCITASSKQTVLLLTLSLMLSACSFSAPKPPDPTIARITVAADNRLNLDSRNRATPVVVRVYILKNIAAFSAADFFSLYEKDQQTLGDTLVWREEMTIKPGEVRNIDPRDPGEGRFVAVLAAFRNIDRAAWRSSVQLLPNKTNNIYVIAKEDSITAAQGIGSSLLKPGELPDASQLKAPEMPQLKVPETPSMPTTPSAPSTPTIPKFRPF